MERPELCFLIHLPHAVSSWHMQLAHVLNTAAYGNTAMAGAFNYHIPVSHCKPLRSHTLLWHCCFDTSNLQLVDMRQLEFRYALTQVRGKFTAKYVLISFLAEVLERLPACTCLY